MKNSPTFSRLQYVITMPEPYFLEFPSLYSGTSPAQDPGWFRVLVQHQFSRGVLPCINLCNFWQRSATIPASTEHMKRLKILVFQSDVIANREFFLSHFF
jgi:hypothetical protein